MFSAATKSSHSAGSVNYIDDVFSTYLYTGTGGRDTISITNNIDLATKGGLVWIKNREFAGDNKTFLSTNGNQYLVTNSLASSASIPSGYGLTSFNTNGFNLRDDYGTYDLNASGNDMVSWTFRKQPKFFDIVTYTGDGVIGKTIPHNLGSVPGCVIVKCTTTNNSWAVYHRSLGGTKYTLLNNTNAATTSAATWNNTDPTSSVFTVGYSAATNTSGDTYVAYLFAHDAGGFGTAGTDNVISCGSYTTDGSGNATVNLGYEPQFVLHKSTGTDSWLVHDAMRGLNYSAVVALFPNLSNAESTFTSNVWISPTSTGFSINGRSANTTYIYIAIRRPMKPPTTGTSVFSPNAFTTSSSANTVTTNFPVDLIINKYRNAASNNNAVDRLRGDSTSSFIYLMTDSTSSEQVLGSYGMGLDNNTGYIDNYSWTNGSGLTAINWNFRRASTFFDEVCYTGTGSARTVAHNLTVAPEMMIVKSRSNSGTYWYVFVSSLGANRALLLNTNGTGGSSSSYWNGTMPTSSVFSLADVTGLNGAGATFVSYLFATVAGVSKVGSYTGTGTVTQTINAGFGASGARWVMIKRTDAAGDWYVFDTARGFTSTSSPYLLMNSTAAEVTGNNGCYADNTGFTLTTNASATVNVNGASYIYLAIA